MDGAGQPRSFCLPAKWICAMIEKICRHMLLKLLADEQNILTDQKTTGDAGYGDQIRSKADDL